MQKTMQKTMLLMLMMLMLMMLMMMGEKKEKKEKEEEKEKEKEDMLREKSNNPNLKGGEFDFYEKMVNVVPYVNRGCRR